MRIRATTKIVVPAVAAVTAFWLLAVLGGPGPLAADDADAAGTCDLYASGAGSPAAPGTLAQPLETGQQLVDRMSPGDVGCLIPGGTFADDPEVRIDTPGVTLTTAPGSAGQARLQARIYLTKNADGSTIENLWINSDTSRNHSLTINGDGITLRDNEITSDHTNICVIVGSPDPQWGRAHDTLITGNRIHDCGTLPATNFDHGIYVSAADDTRITGNWIYDNADRGIQMYADADHTVIKGNVIDGNGEGVIFGGHDETTSDHNLVANNVITNSKLRDNLESSWGAAGPGSGNVARDNCISGGAYDDGDGGILGGPAEELGFSASRNLLRVPVFANRAAGDFSVSPDSVCGKILAGASAAEATGGGAGPAHGDRHRPTLKTGRHSIKRNKRVRVRGKAPAGRRVTILRRKGKRWVRAGGSRIRRDGHFQDRVRARRSVRGRVVLKARVRGVGKSRALRLKLR